MTLTARTFRVFISSTFEDLKEERDALQRAVFPRLAALCAGFDARFQPIDLRWGVREEAALDQRTMEICLAEVARCKRTGLKPNFVILLGERYGWQPLPARIRDSEFQRVLALVEPASKGLVESWYQLDLNAVPPEQLLKPRGWEYQDWPAWEPIERRLHGVLAGAARQAGLEKRDLAKYVASATEQEIIAGIGCGTDAEHVFAFFREGGATEDPALAALKQRLRLTLPAGHVEEFRRGDAADLCERVYRTLERALSAQAQRLVRSNERDAHDRFADERAASVFGRRRDLEAIQIHLDSGPPQPLVVHGPSGSGKSAIMARASRARGVIRRFIGVTAESSSGVGLLRSVCQDLEEKPVELPGPFNELVEVFHDRLQRATAERPIVLFIDGVDQLDAQDPAAAMRWLPATLPPHCRVVVSTTDIPAALQHAPVTKLQPLAIEATQEALERWFEDAGRRLQSTQLETVVAASARSGLPLYLKLAFEEARGWRSFDPPDRCTLREDLPDIIDQLFARISSPSNHGEVVVTRTLGYMAAARYGLSEDELLAVLTQDEQVWADVIGEGARRRHDPPLRQLPVIVWSRLHLDLAPYLTERVVPGGNVIGFFHPQMAGRVASASLCRPALAEYFGKLQPISLRKATEWPWQLSKLGAWDALRSALGDLDLFDALYSDEHRWELSAYWVALRRRGFDLEACYADAWQARLDLDAAGPTLMYRLANFLIESDAGALARRVMDAAAAAVGDGDFATAQGSLATLLEDRGEYQAALAIRERVLLTHEQAFGSRDPFTATACINLAGTLLRVGRIAEAEAMARRALAIDEEAFGKGAIEVAKDLVTLGESLRQGGRLAEAEKAQCRALDIARLSLPARDAWFATILGNLGMTQSASGRPADAEATLREAVEIEREVRGSRSPKLAIRLHNLANVMRDLGHLPEAGVAAEEALKILVAHSVATGAPHPALEPAAVSLAEIATASRLPSALAVSLVNGILRPLRDATSTRTEPNVSPASEASPPAARQPGGTSATRHVPAAASSQEGAAAAPTHASAMPSRDIAAQVDPQEIRKRAWQGDTHAEYNLAVLCQTEGRLREAESWYRRAAERGVAPAQFNLGVFLQNGTAGTTNLPEAIGWYEKAAAQGYVNAIYNLAFMRENGLGCTEDPRAAFELYESAAALGEPDSQCKLAILLMDEAHQARVGYPYRKRSQADRKSRVTSWLARLGVRHEQPHPDAARTNTWSGIPIDHARARELLRRAATSGQRVAEEAMRTLGWS